MYCGYCGKKISEASNFCAYCGKSIELQKPQNELSEFVKRARDGDSDAFTVLYEKTYNQAFYTVKSMIKDDDVVNDILQDSYIKTFVHIDSFKGDDKFLPWIKQIAANTARDWIKKKKPILFTDLSDDEDITFEEQIEDDIADAMGVSQSAIKSRLKYGRDKIKAKITELESKGTKLYGIAPFTFWLFLINNIKEFTVELTPDLKISHNVMEKVDIFSNNHPKTKPTKGISKGSVKSPNLGLAATGTGGLGALKIILIALIGSTVIGVSIFGVSKLFGEKNAARDFVEDALEERLSDNGEINSDKDGTDLKEMESEESTEVISSISQNDEALEQYKIVVEQSSTYKFSGDYYFSPTGNY